MEDKVNENLNKTVKLLIQELEIQSRKISKLEKHIPIVDKLSERTRKLEKALDDEKDQTDKRFDNVIERFDDCNNTIVDHIDSIDDLENKFSKLTTQMVDLDEAIKKVDNEIKEIESRKQSEENNVFDEKVIKECKFDKFGYCFKGSECEFFHSQQSCQIYLDSGLCNKVSCRERHPRPCYYYQRGYCKRNEECRYLHVRKPNQCDNCERRSGQNYFCEFCSKSYCCQCTVEEAHKKDVYGYEDVGCKNIHLF